MTPISPAYEFMKTLERERAILEHDLPTDSKIVATLTLTTGELFQITSAYVMEPDILVFIGTREKEPVRVVTRYGMIAHCVFRTEKGKRLPMGFYLEPPSPSPSPSASPSA
jgi:hypothetical protein